jgi:hypothetical protein
MARPEVRDGSIIFSHSMGTDDWLVFHDDHPMGRYRERQARWEAINPVVYKSAGNGHARWPDRQDEGAHFHPPRVMSVGAVERGGGPGRPRPRLKAYSEPGATLTSPVLIADGTSFSTPYVAAVHAALTSHYGKWREAHVGQVVGRPFTAMSRPGILG